TPPPRAEATPAPARRFAATLGNAGLPRLVWAIHRTGRPGLFGIALLIASALFLFSTHLPLAAEVEALRADLATKGPQARAAATEKLFDPASILRVFPPREDMPSILRQLYGNAVQARLAVDSAKYELSSMGSSGIVRYQVAFPVTGPYLRIRSFIDATLGNMPTVALDDLAIDRKSISDGSVEAQIRIAVFTAVRPRQEPAEPARQKLQIDNVVLSAPRDRVVPPTHPGALFAQHSWYVLPPAPPPAAPPPPPEPTAPPFPYTYIGSFTPEGQSPVFFLSHGDRVIEARVGDRLDGGYQFESRAGA